MIVLGIVTVYDLVIKFLFPDLTCVQHEKVSFHI
jgi:hypothetical protein